MFWAADSQGCGFYRCDLPAAELARRGHRTHSACAWLDSNIGKGDGWHKPDVLVGQRVALAAPSVLWRRACKDPAVYAVYEMDDDLFSIPQSNRSAYEFFSNEENRDRIVGNIEMADAVTVSTPQLAEVVSKHNKNVHVIPNTIPFKYMVNVGRSNNYDVGWHGSGTHIKDWAITNEQIQRWLRRNPTRQMLMIGSHYAEGWGLFNVDYKPWVSPVSAMWDALDFDIGLAPLRADVFNRSKSHVKALEYAIRGIPCIASDVHPYREFVRHGESGMLVRREHEWGRYLHALTKDPAMRDEMGKAAFKQALRFTTEEWGTAWCRALGISERATLGV